MKTIQWYPGHMAKAVRMMKDNIPLCDGVIFVLDARCPASSYNPKLKDIAGSKPVLFVLNKSDLSDVDLTPQMRGLGLRVVCACGTSPSSKRAVDGAIRALVEEKKARLAQKGVNKVFRFMVAGVPNTGKSTLINLLAGSRRAETGDKAGVTRGKQWISCGDYELLDTPGTMPPACDNQTFAARLAFCGSINDEILDRDDICLELISALSGKYFSRLRERYGVEEGTPAEVLDGVCKKRGFLLRGGEYDYERGVRAVVDDFRKGKLGKITFDGAEDIEAAFGG